MSALKQKLYSNQIFLRLLLQTHSYFIPLYMSVSETWSFCQTLKNQRRRNVLCVFGAEQAATEGIWGRGVRKSLKMSAACSEAGVHVSVTATARTDWGHRAGLTNPGLSVCTRVSVCDRLTHLLPQSPPASSLGCSWANTPSRRVCATQPGLCVCVCENQK